MNDTEKAKIRNTIILFFHRLINKKVNENNIDKMLISLNNSTRSKNPNIIFTRADKGNVTVAMNRDEYRSKIETMLQDKNIHNS